MFSYKKGLFLLSNNAGIVLIKHTKEIVMGNKTSCAVMGDQALKAVKRLQDGETIDIAIDTLKTCEDNFFELNTLQSDFDAEGAFAHISMLRDIMNLLNDLRPENQ